MTETARRQKILYVEDEPDNFAVAQLRLKKSADLEWAKTDQEACERLKADGKSYSAILMDIELKGSILDGRALIQLIRGRTPAADLPPYARGVPKLETPIIVVTAYGDRFPEAELRAGGATHYMAKPIDFLNLSLALANASIRGLNQTIGRG